jgi:hypothetical protein
MTDHSIAESGTVATFTIGSHGEEIDRNDQAAPMDRCLNHYILV